MHGKYCEDLLKKGHSRSGVYSIWPNNSILTGSILVYCDMETDGGGWTIIQRRGDFGNEEDYFYRGWQSYKDGFGNLEKEFWLGNDNIYAITNQGPYSIRFDLEDFDGDKAFAVYSNFQIEDESNGYRVHVSNYSGNAGDSFSYHESMKFTTRDRDNDGMSYHNCAVWSKGAWWYKSCFHSNLNGKYLRRRRTDSYEGIRWDFWKYEESLAATEMKLRKHRSAGN